MTELLSEWHGKKLWKVSEGDYSLVAIVEHPKFYRVVSFLVDKQKRRKGIATKLMTEVIAHFSTKSIYLEVDSFDADDSDPNDEQLGQFYAKFGFKRYKQHPYAYERRLGS